MVYVYGQCDIPIIPTYRCVKRSKAHAVERNIQIYVVVNIQRTFKRVSTFRLAIFLATIRGVAFSPNLQRPQKVNQNPDPFCLVDGANNPKRTLLRYCVCRILSH